MLSFDRVIIGAGVIGLAIAKEASEGGESVLVVEAESKIGQGTSSRNSEVIHAGIYYPPGSLRAGLCVQGKNLLYQYCAERSIEHRRTGKLIVAVHAIQVATLEKLKGQAEKNGVSDLELIDSKKVKELEPLVQAEAALISPSTGIINSHEFMEALQSDAEKSGAVFIFRHRFQAAQRNLQQLKVKIRGPDQEDFEVDCKFLVNSAGLGAQKVAEGIEGFPTEKIPKQYLAKGSYFRYSKKSPFQHLVYPVPELGSLGIHSRIDLGGQTWFGPDHEPVGHEEYNVDTERGNQFYPSIRTYFPSLADAHLEPGYAGIRPKIHAPGTPTVDFWIEGPAQHGFPGVIQLFGIESPGLTASLAMAKYVMKMGEGQ